MPDLTIEFGTPCIVCDEAWEDDGLLGRLMAEQLNRSLETVTMCTAHKERLREKLEPAGFTFKDESMRWWP